MLPIGPRRGSDARRRNDEEPLIFGIHAVEAALANPQRVIRKLFLTDNAERRLHDCAGGTPAGA